MCGPPSPTILGGAPLQMPGLLENRRIELSYSPQNWGPGGHRRYVRATSTTPRQMTTMPVQRVALIGSLKSRRASSAVTT